ncbi:MAG: hypothetical protein GY708_12360 [Actinomycetia bacterium]|nr:hypothetical protein [Actinomycetes bacterium]MCP4959168.1 hypothetical protein [Actinomycetes bacterium]
MEADGAGSPPAQPPFVGRETHRSRDRLLLSALVPVVLAVVAFGLAFVIRSSADARYGYAVTLSTRHDGTTGPFDNRSQLMAVLTDAAYQHEQAGTDSSVDLVARFNNLIDIRVDSSSAGSAEATARQFVDLAISDRKTASTALASSRLDALISQADATRETLTRAVSDLAALPAGDDSGRRDEVEHSIDSLTTAHDSLSRSIEDASTELAAVVVPVDVTTSHSLGQIAPRSGRDASIAAAVAALISLVTLTLTVWRND